MRHNTEKEDVKKKKKLEALQHQLNFSFSFNRAIPIDNQHFNPDMVVNKKTLLSSMGACVGTFFMGAFLYFLSRHYQVNLGPMGCVIQDGKTLCETTDITTPISCLIMIAATLKMILNIQQYRQLKDNHQIDFH